MRVPYRFAAPWLGYWSYMSDRSMGRWCRMADEVDERKYGSDKLLCDMLQFWTEAANGWFAAMRGGCTDLPHIFFLLDPCSESACKEIDFFTPSCPSGVPQLAYLRRWRGNPKEINASKVTVCLSPHRHALVVHLDQLRKKSDPPLTAGFYQGLIHSGEEPVALLSIKVPEGPIATSGGISTSGGMGWLDEEDDNDDSGDSSRTTKAKAKKKRAPKRKA